MTCSNIIGTSSIAALLMLGCTPQSPEKAPNEAVTSAPLSEADERKVNGIIGDWWATDLRINGMRDPGMNPTNKVKWHIAADSSFSMWDASEGTPDSMSGKWSMTNENTVFRMHDQDNGEITSFKIIALSNDSLKLQVLEDTGGAEVLLSLVRR